MRNPNPSPRSDPDVLTRFHEELARAAAMPALAPAGPALWPRFAGYYQGLTRLPRRLRRALQRRWRRSLGGIALLCALGPAAMAATINVDETCLLINAINSANSNTSVTGCESGSGADTIVLTNGRRVFGVDNSEFGPTGFPVIRSQITIQGNGNPVLRDGNGDSIPEFRIFAVGVDGDLTLENIKVSGGVADDGDGGGGIRSLGRLTLINSTISGNLASFGGGISGGGTTLLIRSTISGNTAQISGGGIATVDEETIFDSAIFGNTAQYGGGAFSQSNATIINSTVSGNTAQLDGGGLLNFRYRTLTLTNSTVSGNTAGRHGGGIDNREGASDALKFTILTLINSRLSGNTAPGFGREVNNAFTGLGVGTVIADRFNLFGHSGSSGTLGFSPGPLDITPNEPLTAILDTTLRGNGGLTPTHALVTGSPALDIVSHIDCATTADQRGLTRLHR